MRDFSTFLPRFWTTGPGKRFRGDLETQAVCIYLFTAPGSNHIGIYYLPIETIAHDIGISLEGASKGLRRGFEGAFCSYDGLTEHVFVYEMAQIQILERAESLKPTDKKIIGVKKELIKYRESIYFQQFIARYRDAFHLTEPEFASPFKAPSKPLASPFEAPSKGHPLRDRDRDRNRNRERERDLAHACARTSEETFTQNFLKSKRENPKPDQASGKVPDSILAAQQQLEEARERLKLDRERERERIEVESNREDSTAIGDIINSFSSNVYTVTNNTDQSNEIDHSDNGPKRPLGSDSSEIDWTIARDIFSAIRSRYGHGSYKPTGYGKYSDSLSDVASWANAETGEWSARELVELSAAGFVVSANEKTKEAKYHPGFWWGDPGAHLQAGLNELKKWELEIVVSELTEAKFTKPKTDEVMRKIETLIKQRDRIEESLSFSTNRAN